MQIHWPGNIGFEGGDPSQWPDAAAAVAALEAAVSAGKILHYGMCNFGLDDVSYTNNPPLLVKQSASCL